jgi:2-methylaconitate cis-trans-isomerase PrpF
MENVMNMIRSTRKGNKFHQQELQEHKRMQQQLLITIIGTQKKKQ